MAIVNDVLDVSKIEAGKLAFETVNFDLVETVESALDMMAERAHGRGIELAAMQPAMPTRLRGDPGGSDKFLSISRESFSPVARIASPWEWTTT